MWKDIRKEEEDKKRVKSPGIWLREEVTEGRGDEEQAGEGGQQR